MEEMQIECDNRVLRGTMSTEAGATGGWNKLHNVGFQDLHPEPDTIRMMLTQKVRWLEHVTQRILIGNFGVKG
jgi:hypothetical protein